MSGLITLTCPICFGHNIQLPSKFNYACVDCGSFSCGSIYTPVESRVRNARELGITEWEYTLARRAAGVLYEGYPVRVPEFVYVHAPYMVGAIDQETCGV